MDYEAYKNTLPWPRKENFSTRYWYKAGRVVAKKVADGDIEILVPGIAPSDLRDCKTDAEIDTEAMAAARAVYGAEEQRLVAQFTQDFYAELGIEDNPKRDKLFSKAWEHGHANGYSEIMNCGWDLVDLIKD